MAKQAAATEANPGPIRRLQDFLQGVRTELGKVTWPTKEDLKVSTKVTMYLLGIMAGITFLFDKIFQVAVLLLLNIAS